MSEATKTKVLVLDDDRIQHLLLRKRMLLVSSEIELTFFEDAHFALDAIATSPPDIIISDINLFKSSGWQFLEKVKAMNFRGKFFLLSGSIHPDDRRRAAEDAFVTGFFEKPIQESDLIYILA